MERVALEPGTDVEWMRMRFRVVDERRARRLEPEPPNVADLMFRLWDLRTMGKLADLIGRLREDEWPLRAAFE